MWGRPQPFSHGF